MIITADDEAAGRVGVGLAREVCRCFPLVSRLTCATQTYPTQDWIRCFACRVKHNPQSVMVTNSIKPQPLVNKLTIILKF